MGSVACWSQKDAKCQTVNVHVKISMGVHTMRPMCHMKSVLTVCMHALGAACTTCLQHNNPLLNLLEGLKVEDLHQEKEAPLVVVAVVEDHQEEEVLLLPELLASLMQQQEELMVN